MEFSNIKCLLGTKFRSFILIFINIVRNPLVIQNLFGQNEFSGRISVYISGNWMPICNPYNSLDQRTLNIMCQTTGFGDAGVIWCKFKKF